MKTLFIILGLLVFFVLACTGQNKNLVKNGTFDGDPSFTSWYSDLGVESKTLGGKPGGYAWLNHKGEKTDPDISQDIEGFKTGVLYLIQGDFRGGDESPTMYNHPGKTVFAVDIDKVEIATFQLPDPVTKWIKFKTYFRAKKDTHTIRFRGEINGTDGDVAIDNIQVKRVADFPFLLSNDNVWSYGFGTVGGDFTPFSKTSKNKEVQALYEKDIWQAVFHNKGKRSVLMAEGLSFQPNDLVMHPGNAKAHLTKIKYTAPVKGIYSVKITWTAIDEQAQNIKTWIYTNAVAEKGKTYNFIPKGFKEIYTQKIIGYKKTANYDKKISLQKGEVILFEVGKGEDTYLNDALRVELKIDLQK